MAKKIKKEVDLDESTLERIYKSADSRRSHFIFMIGESEETINQLLKDKWAEELKFKTKSRMFAITYKLIEKFREFTNVEHNIIFPKVKKEEII
jgi:hypothetical protein